MRTFTWSRGVFVDYTRLSEVLASHNSTGLALDWRLVVFILDRAAMPGSEGT